MNSTLRHEKIMERLLSQREVSVNELSEQLQVTGKTIREDLSKLEEQGLLVRVHGGAMLKHQDQFGMLSVYEPIIQHREDKTSIAERALKYIEQDAVIALDGGSTTLEIARLLENRPYTVITNDLHIIGALTAKDQIRLVVPGGYRVRNMLTGTEGIDYMRKLNVQTAFISATGIHLEQGLSVFTGDFIEMKRAMLEMAQKVYAVVDHSKFDRSALRTVASIQELDGIITDAKLSEEIYVKYQQAGVMIDRF
ncbi:DeoR/GlpR family DNA-binding transcription regulator [Paenibacillus guangzhouensis]|uniref:DeoR/GlpR family DNA-binding transcription regulator n=1 Tax=Paenibacillus guangzhouensis TaxID=1473112 RepID=UPI00126731C2|nr:DeoR/GlpR family DNA-binding transcription regulator [Paenibacillus guangzhouensis]